MGSFLVLFSLVQDYKLEGESPGLVTCIPASEREQSAFQSATRKEETKLGFFNLEQAHVPLCCMSSAGGRISQGQCVS